MLQKYRLYLKRLGGFNEKDKVEPEALQAIHEVKVNEQACQHEVGGSQPLAKYMEWVMLVYLADRKSVV